MASFTVKVNGKNRVVDVDAATRRSPGRKRVERQG